MKKFNEYQKDITNFLNENEWEEKEFFGRLFKSPRKMQPNILAEIIHTLSNGDVNYENQVIDAIKNYKK